MELEKKLNVLLNMRGLSQSSLARKTGVTQTTVSRFLSGHSSVSAKAFVRILACIGIDMDALLSKQISKLLFNSSAKNSLEQQHSAFHNLALVFQHLDGFDKKALIDTLLQKAKSENPKLTDRDCYRQLQIYSRKLSNQYEHGG